MAKTKVESLITQSLIDRLSNQEEWPTTSRKWPNTRSESMQMYRHNLKRDVEWLLNTRQPQIPWLSKYPNAMASVVNFGLPDIATFTSSQGKDQNALLAALLQTIRTFEPRILHPQVFLARTDPLSRSMQFHIEGEISYETMQEEITFDTVLELIRGDFKVK